MSKLVCVHPSYSHDLLTLRVALSSVKMAIPHDLTQELHSHYAVVVVEDAEARVFDVVPAGPPACWVVRVENDRLDNLNLLHSSFAIK